LEREKPRATVSTSDEKLEVVHVELQAVRVELSKVDEESLESRLASWTSILEQGSRFSTPLQEWERVACSMS
jgi:hypothetical protein